MIKTNFPHINPQVAVSVKSLEGVWGQQKVQGDGTAAKKTLAMKCSFQFMNTWTKTGPDQITMQSLTGSA